MAFSRVFQSGARLLDGEALNRALAYLDLAFASGLVAKASGTVANSTPITETLSQVDTVVTAADGMLLPAALAGNFYLLINNSANATTVFAAGLSTINGTAGATGVSQAGNTRALYVCAKNAAWFRLLGA